MPHWFLLDLAPTADTRAIKRAYAARLKCTRPDEDPQGFQALRQAYEVALRQAAEGDFAPSKADEIFDWLSAGGDAEPEVLAESPTATVATDAAVTETVAASPSAPPPWASRFIDPPEDFSPAPADDSLLAPLESYCQQIDARGAFDPTALDRLLLDRRWQAPESARQLQSALLVCIERKIHPEQDAADGRAPLASTAWLATLEQAAAHFGWLTHLPAWLSGHADLLDRLRLHLGRRAIDEVTSRMDSEGEDAAAALLRQQLDGVLFSHLDNRLLLKQLWIEHLTDTDCPGKLVDLVHRAFGWHLDPDDLLAQPLGEQLAERHKAEHDRLLLLRIVLLDEIKHPAITVASAALLLRPKIGFAGWWASLNEKKQGQVHATLDWLDAEAPEALQEIAPKVLRWWRKPWPVQHYFWYLAALLSGFYQIAVHDNQLPDSGGLRLLAQGALLLLGGIAGYLSCWCFAWARLRWRTIYQRWQHWDLQQTARLPGMGDWLASRNIGLTRDLAPYVLLVLVQTALLTRHDSGSFPENLVIALLSSLLPAWIWSKLLRAFSHCG